MISIQQKNSILESVSELPEFMQETLASFDWLTILDEIGTKYRLSDLQNMRFVTESTLVILRAVDPNMYVTNIMNHCTLSQATAESIATDVQDRIMLRLQSEHKRLHADLALVFASLISGEQSPALTNPNISENADAPPVYSSVVNRPFTANEQGDPYKEPIE